MVPKTTGALNFNPQYPTAGTQQVPHLQERAETGVENTIYTPKGDTTYNTTQGKSTTTARPFPKTPHIASPSGGR